MNRHQRRASAKKNRTAMGPETASQAMELFQALQEFSKLAERLKPHLEQLERLSEELREAETVMEELGQENQVLRNELTLQREMTLRLCAALHGKSLASVRSIEESLMNEMDLEDAKIKSEIKQLLSRLEPNAYTNTEEG